MPHLQGILFRIQSHAIAAVINKELSGIYTHQDNEKRVIKFFLNNYLKKIYNSLKSILRQPNAMIDEEEQVKVKEEQETPPPLDVTIVRMIQEYLNNGQLFKVSKEKGMKNLIQHMYDWETTVREHYYAKVLESEPLKQESIDSFLKKEFLRSRLWIPQFPGGPMA